MPQQRYQRRSPQQWQALINQHAASGLSQAAFCNREGIAISSFKIWRRRLTEAPATATTESSASALFAALVADASEEREEAAAEELTPRRWKTLYADDPLRSDVDR